MESVDSVVLLDVPDGRGQFDQKTLENMGHRVVVCHGPEHKELCPILRKGGECTNVTGAHGIVFELDLDRAQHRAILQRYQSVVKEGVPIRVLLQEGQSERYGELLEGVDVWTHDPTVSELDAFSARVEGFERVSQEE